MIKKTLVAAAAALTASAAVIAPASAQPETPIRGAVMFWLLDRNNDGAIDKTEIEALRATIFETVDTDSDGKVTSEEFVAAIGQMRELRGQRGPRGERHGQFEQRGDRRGPPNGEFAERRGGPGPRDNGPDARGDHRGPRGGEYAERGHGPKHGARRGDDCGPNGDQAKRHDGQGPRDHAMDRRGERRGPPKGDLANRQGGPGPQHDRFEKRGDRNGPPRAELAEHRQDRMMQRFGIDASEGLGKSDFVTAMPKLFDRADTDGNGSISQSEFDQVGGNIGRLIVME